MTLHSPSGSTLQCGSGQNLMCPAPLAHIIFYALCHTGQIDGWQHKGTMSRKPV